MLLLALLLQTTPAPAAPTPPDVVVTGQRLETTAAALRACIERKCPTDEDVRATLAHAENQFVSGDYRAARATLGDSINRNKGAAKAFPVPVSDLMRANARMNLHLGETQLYRLNQVDSLNALRAGLPATDGRVLAQRIEVADAYARLSDFDPALAAYSAVAEDARKANQPTVEAFARLRRVVLLSAMSKANAGYEPDLRAAVRWFTDRPQLKSFGAVAELMAARYYARKGDPAALDAIIAASAQATTRPQLLFAPSFNEEDRRTDYNGSTSNQIALSNYDGQWVDIGFWVTPAGKVNDVGVLREGPAPDKEWVKRITDGIAQRRYAPLAMAKDEPGLLRVERYTLTADLGEVTGSRIRQRNPTPRVQMIDLTADPGIPAAPKG